MPWSGHEPIGTTFRTRSNSLNFLRLALAIAVVFSHAITIGSFGSESILGKTTLGTMAVYGFFGLSGYLIAASADRHHIGRFLWQRFLRIYPAVWLCSIVTAFVFGSLVWIHSNPTWYSRCGLSCYFTEHGGPIGYVLRNSLIWVSQSTIAHTLPLGYFRPVWNGSVWTLSFELMCYLMIAVLSLFRLLAHPMAVAFLAGSVWIAEVAITSVPSWNHQFSPSNHWVIMKLMTFMTIFLVGSLFYLYRDRVPDSGLLAAVCAMALLGGLVLPLGNSVPAFTLTSMDLTSIFIVYPLIWLGIHLPLKTIGRRNDYSYGVYIYAYPVQQMLVVWGVARWGYWPYALLSVLAVAPFAIASWWVVEKHALRLKSMRWNRTPVRPTAAPPMTAP